MHLLAIRTFLYGFHDDVFCHHKRQLRIESALDYAIVDNKLSNYIWTNHKNCINCPKCIWNINPPSRWIIQRSLEHLCRRGLPRHHWQPTKISRKWTNPLTSHRITLVCHRWRANLLFSKRFLNLLVMLKQTNIKRHLVCRSSNRC